MKSLLARLKLNFAERATDRKTDNMLSNPPPFNTAQTERQQTILFQVMEFLHFDIYSVQRGYTGVSTVMVG